MGFYETELKCNENGDNCVVMTSTIDMSSEFRKICSKHSPSVGNKLIYSLNSFLLEYSKKYIYSGHNHFEIEVLETYDIKSNTVLRCKLEKNDKILLLLNYLDNNKMKFFSWFNDQPSWIVKEDCVEIILIWNSNNLFVV